MQSLRSFPIQIHEHEKLLPKMKNSRFCHPWPVEQLSHYDLIKWLLTRKKKALPSASEINSVYPDKNDLLCLSDHNKASSKFVIWLGHSTVLLRMQNKTFLFDPVFSQKTPAISGPKRYVNSLIDNKDVISKVDYVLISHNHYDHLDVPSIKTLSAWFPNILWFCGLNVGNTIKNAISTDANINEMTWFDTWMNEDESIQIIYLPAQHNSIRYGIDYCKALWGGWAICSKDSRFYFAGDTGYNTEMFQTIGKVIGPFDLSAIPIGAYKPRKVLRMNHICPEEAVQAHKDITSKKSFGIHWATFPLSDENFDDPRIDLSIALQQSNVNTGEFVTLKIGQMLEF